MRGTQAQQWIQSGMNAVPSPIQIRHQLRLRLLCIVQVIQHMMGTKTECRRADHLHLRSIEAVELPVMIHHRTDVEEDAVFQNLHQVDRINDPDLQIEIKREIEIEIDHGSILEEIDQDLDQEEGHVLEIEDVAVVVIEVKIDIEVEKAVGIIEHHRMNQIMLKITQKQLYHIQLFLHNLMPLRMMGALWKCLRKCKNKCNLHKNRRLLF